MRALSPYKPNGFVHRVQFAYSQLRGLCPLEAQKGRCIGYEGSSLSIAPREAIYGRGLPAEKQSSNRPVNKP